MIRTRICDLLGIAHPIVLGGMGTATTAPLVAAVSNAGGFGTLGTSAFNAATLDTEIASIRERTGKPFGINHLLFQIQEEMFTVTLGAKPTVAAFAWARKDQDLHAYFQRAHDAGAKVMYMAGEVTEATRAAEAGADVIVAQGTEAGGHVGWMASLPLVPMMVKAVAPLPVLCAGGIADVDLDGPGGMEHRHDVVQDAGWSVQACARRKQLSHPHEMHAHGSIRSTVRGADEGS